MNVNEAIAAVKANPRHELYPLPWGRRGIALVSGDGYIVGGDLLHIAAAVNAAPVLVAEVERLSAAVATAERLREEDRMKLIRCKSAMREWQVASEFADDRAVKANKEVERLQAVVEAARVAVEESWRMAQEKLDWRDHDWGRKCSDSASQPCCGSDAHNANLMALRRKLDEARRALGLG